MTDNEILHTLQTKAEKIEDMFLDLLSKNENLREGVKTTIKIFDNLSEKLEEIKHEGHEVTNEKNSNLSETGDGPKISDFGSEV